MGTFLSHAPTRACNNPRQARASSKNCAPSLWDIIDNNKSLNVVRRVFKWHLQGQVPSSFTQEQTLARSKFSGNYTLIRDLYSEGGANFTAIIPRDLYVAGSPGFTDTHPLHSTTGRTAWCQAT